MKHIAKMEKEISDDTTMQKEKGDRMTKAIGGSHRMRHNTKEKEKAAITAKENTATKREKAKVKVVARAKHLTVNEEKTIKKNQR